MATVIAVGGTVPDTTFRYVPYEPALDNLTICGTPIDYSISTQWAGKKVLVFAVPGAFTPTCHVHHLPGYLQNHDKIKEKGIDIIAVIAANDPFVMSAWARVSGLKDKIIALSDAGAEWSKSIGLSVDQTSRGLGIRTRRYALVLDNLVVQQVQVEEERGKVTATGADGLLALL